MPSELSGEPFPFRIVFGIDAAVRPAAFPAVGEVDVTRMAIVNRTAIRETFTGYLQG
jgi:hypothetical protein